MHDNKKEKVLVIIGPTASGKTSLSIELAKKFNGEIISADSRQIYRGLNIGTEKVTKEEMQGVPHYLIDVCEPEDVFSVQQFVDKAQEAIATITRSGKLPIIAGGTGFYIDALLYETEFPNVEPDPNLRSKLEQQPAEELYAQLQAKDPERAEAIDPNNKRRLIRALEVIEALGKVPHLREKKSRYDHLIIGIKTDDKVLKEKIENRLNQSLMNGLMQETVSLLQSGVSTERMNEFGLEYRIALEVIEGRLPGEQMKEKMLHELWKYAKRQRTWFKRNEEIEWFPLNEKEKIHTTIEKFLK